ncbi:hypothetical protein ACFQ07_04750, partial [Actinomadura adrarensis]
MDDKYVLISTDSHAGLPAEGYRDYVDARYREAFDQAAAEAEAMRELSKNDDTARFLAEWDSEIGEHGGMKGAYDPEVRNKEMDHDGVAAEVVFPDADSAGVGGVTKTP